MKERVLKVAGILLAVLASAYFVRYAWKALAGRDLSGLLDRQVLYAALLLTGLYAASIVTTAFAWTRMLASMRQPHAMHHLLPILATTQFGKYLPGNVAHHLGRVALARSIGIQVAPAVLSVTYELLLALVAAAHLGALTLLWSPPAALSHLPLAQHRVGLITLVTLGALTMLTLAPRAATFLVRFRSNNRENREKSATAPLKLDFANAAVCYLMYMLGQILIGFGLWLLAKALATGGSTIPGPLFFIGAFASSWILGFVAPGAPAGLGVREAILSAWLGGVLPSAQAVLLIITLRIATTGGDLLNFVWGSIVVLWSRSRKEQQALEN
jgi:hypothetical protein